MSNKDVSELWTREVDRKVERAHWERPTTNKTPKGKGKGKQK